MPTPLYSLRLPQKTQDDIAEMGRIYGAPNGRAFAREILEVMTSGDVERVKAFNTRLCRGMGEQLSFRLNASLDASVEGEKPTLKPVEPAKAKKGALRRAKRP